MNQIKELRQIKDFSTGNKVRDLILTEINPTVMKVIEECDLIRQEMKLFQQKYSNVLKFESEKQTLQNTVKQLSEHFFKMNSELVALKTETELNQTKNFSEHSALRGEVNTFEKVLSRRDETLQLYDRKINGVMDGLSKHQILIGDRMTVFEERFKKLSKQTLQMTKTLKHDFDSSNMHNQILKSELLSKMRNNDEKERILDLYVSEREQTARKILQLEQSIKHFVNNKELDDFKRVQTGFIEDNFSKVKAFLSHVLPEETINSLRVINVKFAQIEELKFRNRKIEEEIKHSVQSIHETIKTIEEKGQEKIAQVRIEQEEVEEKIIQEIDKRFQTIQQNIQQRGTQTEEDIEEKLQLLRKQLQKTMNLRLSEQNIEISQLKEARKLLNSKGEESMISKELATAQEQREKIMSYGDNIKQIAHGLNQKLALFSNRITVCKSDIEIFTADTKKQLKKIIQIKADHEHDMQVIGKLLSSLTESLLILAALGVNGEKLKQNNVFSTYQDGILLEVDPKVEELNVVYRRTLMKSVNLKESLLYSLISIVDQTIISNGFLKWDHNRPSNFFKIIKENIEIKTKTTLKNLSFPFTSSKPMKRSGSRGGEESFMEDKKDGDDANRETNIPQQKSRMTITNGTTVWPLERPNSEMHKRYKMKKPEQFVFKRENSDRLGFTSSRSHRKTKIACL